ncbi:hypothetical protein GMOD_00002307 [Pyrenophora seminiperda CCB06]|uniref:Uncharacterized protein n=1 Tax=Pyrenophora seminiperda CCB06 TaxID=1302712 RepID=A0A3M7LXD5_9PLEO|nr:hypothetical protein GMOD_00002307 [Pyrenophora seminiperda CCB06]
MAKTFAAVTDNDDEPDATHNIVTGLGGAPGGGCGIYACDWGMHKCVKACGIGPQCKPYCACKTHGNPQSLCRTQGCVEAPQGCEKYNFKKRGVYGRDEAAADTSESVGKLDVDLPPPPFNPCPTCGVLYNICLKKCGTGPECPVKCKCQLASPKSMCKHCPSLKCPRPSVRKVHQA